MSQAAVRHMSLDEFFAFQKTQDVRYELVNGEPVRMMAGAARVHNAIVINVVSELRSRLRGTGCTPFNGDDSVQTYPGQIRRPDAGIDCGDTDRRDLCVSEPRVIVEVLSPSIRDFDTHGKVGEYEDVASVHTILLIDPDEPNILVRRRVAEGWRWERVTSLDDEIAIAEPDLVLPLAAIYQDIEFPDAT